MRKMAIFDSGNGFNLFASFLLAFLIFYLFYSLPCPVHRVRESFNYSWGTFTRKFYFGKKKNNVVVLVVVVIMGKCFERTIFDCHLLTITCSSHHIVKWRMTSNRKKEYIFIFKHQIMTCLWILIEMYIRG
jgi:hypothetical protein